MWAEQGSKPGLSLGRVTVSSFVVGLYCLSTTKVRRF